MIEAELLQPFEPRTIERHRGRDQIGIEPGLGRGLDDLLEILARGGLAAGEMHLQDAHLAGLRHRRAPFLGGQLLVDALELERVGAIGALQGTAMGQLGEEPHRSERAQRFARANHAFGRLVVNDKRLEMCLTVVHPCRAHAFIYPLSASPCSSSNTSLRITSTGAA